MSNPQPFWPVIDHEHRHIRTPDGSTVIPFHVIARMVCIAAVLIGVEATFGLTNWITIPVGVLALGWAIEQCDHAAITRSIQDHHADREDQP